MNWNKQVLSSEFRSPYITLVRHKYKIPMDQIFAVSVTGCMVRLQSVRLCYDLRDRIRPIRLEDSIRKRIGRPIWFEIRFERRKTIRRSLDCMLHGACSLVLVNTSYAITTCTRNQVWIYSTLRVKSVSGILIVFFKDRWHNWERVNYIDSVHQPNLGQHSPWCGCWLIFKLYLGGMDVGVVVLGWWLCYFMKAKHPVAAQDRLWNHPSCIERLITLLFMYQLSSSNLSWSAVFNNVL